MTAIQRKYLLFALVGGLTLFADQVTKILVRRDLPAYGQAGKSIFGRTLVLLHAENTGIAFSQFRSLPGGRVVLSLVAATALAIVVSYLHRADPAEAALVACLGLVGGGTAGNLLDRARFGQVTDFVLVDFGFWPFHPWAVFNVADAALVVGVILIVMTLMRQRRLPENHP